MVESGCDRPLGGVPAVSLVYLDHRSIPANSAARVRLFRPYLLRRYPQIIHGPNWTCRRPVGRVPSYQSTSGRTNSPNSMGCHSITDARIKPKGRSSPWRWNRRRGGITRRYRPKTSRPSRACSCTSRPSMTGIPCSSRDCTIPAIRTRIWSSKVNESRNRLSIELDGRRRSSRIRGPRRSLSRRYRVLARTRPRSRSLKPVIGGRVRMG